MRSPATDFLLLLFLLIAVGPGCSEDDSPTDENWPALVRPDGSGGFPTIQSAINAAVAGDTVLLAAGTFTGPGNRNIDFLGKRIAVTAAPEARGAVVIDCQGQAQGFAFHSGEGSGSRLVGVTIVNGRAIWGAAVLCVNESSPTIVDCEFSGCVVTDGGGAMSVAAGCEPVITRCRFSGNSSDFLGGAVWIGDAAPQFFECVFDGNTAASGGAMAVLGGAALLAGCTVTQNGPDGVLCVESDLTLTNTIIAENSPGLAVSCTEDCWASLACCDIWGNGGDWEGCIADQAGLRNNFSADPLFCDRMGGDFRILAISPCAAGDGPCGRVGALGNCN